MTAFSAAASAQRTGPSARKEKATKRLGPPELFQIVIQCADEPQQRDLFERLRREGLKLRLLVL
ncbi:MAG: hypothetical protein WD872_15430 [Pirellulaceae bacterium]